MIFPPTPSSTTHEIAVWRRRIVWPLTGASPMRRQVVSLLRVTVWTRPPTSRASRASRALIVRSMAVVYAEPKIWPWIGASWRPTSQRWIWQELWSRETSRMKASHSTMSLTNPRKMDMKRTKYSSLLIMETTTIVSCLLSLRSRTRTRQPIKVHVATYARRRSLEVRVRTTVYSIRHTQQLLELTFSALLSPGRRPAKTKSRNRV